MQNMDLLQIKKFVLLDENCKIDNVKMFKIRGTSHYDINVTCILSSKDYQITQILIPRKFSVFTAFDKKMVKFSVKTQ